MEPTTPNPEPEPQPAPPASPLDRAWATLKANRTLSLIGGGVLALAVLCCLCGVVLVAINSGGDDEDPAALPSSATSAPANPAPSAPAPKSSTSTPAPKPSLFNMPLGTGITVTSGSSSWRINVTSHSYTEDDGCSYTSNDLGPGQRYLIVNVEFEVTAGTASINPFDFTYVDTTGHAGGRAFTCNYDDDIDSANGLPVGSKRIGTITFKAPQSAGTVEYASGLRTNASWTIPAQ